MSSYPPGTPLGALRAAGGFRWRQQVGRSGAKRVSFPLVFIRLGNEKLVQWKTLRELRRLSQVDFLKSTSSELRLSTGQAFPQARSPIRLSKGQAFPQARSSPF